MIHNQLLSLVVFSLWSESSHILQVDISLFLHGPPYLDNLSRCFCPVASVADKMSCALFFLSWSVLCWKFCNVTPSMVQSHVCTAVQRKKLYSQDCNKKYQNIIDSNFIFFVNIVEARMTANTQRTARWVWDKRGGRGKDKTVGNQGYFQNQHISQTYVL